MAGLEGALDPQAGCSSVTCQEMSVPSGLVMRTAAALANSATMARSIIRHSSSGYAFAREMKSS